MGDGLTDALLVYDDGPGAGLGHRRRMEAVARALRARGVAVRTVATDALAGGGEGDGSAAVLLVDSYHRRADDPGVRRFGDALVAAVDDVERDLDVDIVVDPSPGADATSHRRAGTALAGAAYALVDLDPGSAQPLGDDVRRVVVTLGGGQADAGPIATELASALPGVEVRVTAALHVDVGAGRVVPLTTTSGLAGELAQADLVVCAGGVTLLEALALGRPTVVVTIAENQRRSVTGTVGAGAAVPATLADAASVAAALARDPDRRRALGRAAAELVDGRGPERVADALIAAVASAHR